MYAGRDLFAVEKRVKRCGRSAFDSKALSTKMKVHNWHSQPAMPILFDQKRG